MVINERFQEIIDRIIRDIKVKYRIVEETLQQNHFPETEEGKQPVQILYRDIEVTPYNDIQINFEISSLESDLLIFNSISGNKSFNLSSEYELLIEEIYRHIDEKKKCWSFGYWAQSELNTNNELQHSVAIT